MSHGDQMEFFGLARASFPEFFVGKRVLEVGSLDINGSVRSFFTDCDYVGIDVGPGRGVDVVIGGENYDAPDGSFDVVLSAECMEHNPNWQSTTRNMIRMLRPAGLFLLTCAAPGRDEHGTARTSPWASPLTVAGGQDYYDNLDHRDFERAGILDPLGVWQHWMNWKYRDLYLAGFNARTEHPAWDGFLDSMEAWIKSRHVIKPIPRVEQFVLRFAGRRVYEGALPVIGLPRRARSKVRFELARRRETHWDT